MGAGVVGVRSFVAAVVVLSLPVFVPVCLAVGQSPDAASGAVVEPHDYRIDGYREPVPRTLKGASVLSNDAANALWARKEAVFIDVYPHAPKPPNLPVGTLWREPAHYSIENAVWLPNVGYGVLSADTERSFKSHLERLTGGDIAKPLVFFCLRNCWMSWNAAKRALSYGYTSVHWYPDGSDGWQETGGLPAEIKPQW